METAAWTKAVFSYPSHVPTMISEEERRYLYWLGNEVWSGEGCVVEIGPWLGGSTVCLAAGMHGSGHSSRSMLQVYDNFIWRDFMSIRASLPLSAGESFHSYFLEYTKDYSDIVDSHIRALPDETIDEDIEAGAKRFSEFNAVQLFDGQMERPVEILFIDGAKSWLGICHLIRTLSDRFIPGKTVLVCQDFKYWGTYWVPLLLMLIREYVEPIHNALHSTTTSFLLTAKIPANLLNSWPDHVADLPRKSTLRRIDDAAKLLSGSGDLAGALNVQLAKVSFLSHHGDDELAIQTFLELEKQWPTRLPASQLDRARSYLNSEKGTDIAAPVRLRIAGFFRRLGYRIRRS